MFTHKVDEDLALKLVEPQDAPRIFELIEQSREYLRQWLPWLDVTTKVSDTRVFIKGTRAHYIENKGMTTAILYKDEIVGIAGFNELDWVNRTALIGYWLGKPYTGKGIMTKVVKALVNVAVYELKMNRIDIRIATNNYKSLSIPKRLGFTEEGILRQAEWLYDHYVDHIVYSMLADQWESIEKEG
ncbi:GNAT family N-acetyltransferase [Radiobacillus kanasensis]|uniref:GNAT family N-acetyltransferase n=1 Tax=Radiobacillus kanasensis TaxID=2844358 RepID=UPI001E40E36C|nr:GNAT family protein [Radiobacillus kanasensis]UFU00429.1 GNAT family N-acetyltransferase [Radiobacillus kanasensis]